MSGHAVNCQRIKMRDAEEIYNEIETKLLEKHTELNFCPIGSFGKKAPDVETGDIDIAIELSSICKEYLKNILLDTFGDTITEVNLNTTPNVMSIGYKYNDIIAQVDFMLITSLEWAKWRFQSPDLKNGESKYKADPKVFLQSFMVSAIPLDMPIEYYEDGVTVISRYKYTLNQEGLYIQKLNYMGKRGKPIKTPTRENYKWLGNNPYDIMRLICPSVAVDDEYLERCFHSVEGLWGLLHATFPYGVNYVKDVEKRFYEEYINNPRSECQLDPNDFPCRFYKG